MMIIKQKRLAIALSVASALGLGATAVHAVEFKAQAIVENTLTVANRQEMVLGTLFATASGGATGGVGALAITAAGVTTASPTPSDAGIKLISLGTPVPAQGAVTMADDFTLTFVDTSTIIETEFADGGTANALGAAQVAVGTELIIAGADPSVASLWLSHFTLGDVSGGTVGTETNPAGSPTPNGGTFPISAGFSETEYVFNIGATVATESGNSLNYEAGTYEGTFEVTASY
jgi:hypothetical protein